MARRRNFIRKRNLDKLKISRSKYKPHQSVRECARRVSRTVTSLEDEAAKPFLDRFGSVGYHELKSWLDRKSDDGKRAQKS